MIKKILLFAVIALGVVACSKDDNNTPDNIGGGNIFKEKEVKNKLLGEWIGTYDIIAERADKKEVIIETLKKIDSGQQTIMPNIRFDFTKAKAVFSETSISFYNLITESPINSFDEYSLKKDTIIDVSNKKPIITYSFQGDKLIGEILRYHNIIDEKGDKKDEEELSKAAETMSNKEFREFMNKMIEKRKLKFRFKFTLTRKQ